MTRRWGAGALTYNGANVLTLSGANTYSGGTQAESGVIALDHATNGAIDAAGGGTIAVLGGGTLELATSGSLANEVDFDSGTGTIEAATGVTATLTGTFGNLGATKIVFGSQSAAGTIVYAAPSIAATPPGVSVLEIAGGTLRDGGDLGLILEPSSASAVTVQIDAGATVDLNGHADQIEALTGSGTLTNAAGGSVIIDGGTFDGVIAGAGSVEFSPGGASSSTTTLTGASTYSGATTIDSSATLVLGAVASIADTSGITDNGTIQLSGGTLGGTSLTGTGVLTGSGTVAANVTGGTLGFTSSGGALTFTGTDTFGGALSGTEAIFAAGTDTFAAGATITVATIDIDGAALTLGANLTNRGAFDLEAGSLNVGSYSLALNKAFDLAGGTITGSGSVTAYTTATLEGHAFTSGSVKLNDRGTLTATGSLSLQGSSGLVVTSKGTYDLTGNGYIYAATAGDTIANQGVIEKTAGTGKSLVTAAVANTGTVEAASGTLDLTGTISGTGTLDIEGSAALELGGIIGAAQTADFGNGNGTLRVDNSAGFHAAVSGFGAGDAITLSTFDDMAQVLFTAASGGGGTLTVTDGSQKFSTHLDGTYNASGFSLTHTASGEAVHYKA